MESEIYTVFSLRFSNTLCGKYVCPFQTWAQKPNICRISGIKTYSEPTAQKSPAQNLPGHETRLLCKHRGFPSPLARVFSTCSGVLAKQPELFVGHSQGYLCVVCILHLLSPHPCLTECKPAAGCFCETRKPGLKSLAATF